MKIKIKSLIKFQLYYLLIIEALISLLHFPSILRYLLDANMILIAILMLIKRNSGNRQFFGKVLNRYIYLYILLVLTYSIIQFVPFGQIVWAFRNNFFFIIFGIACGRFLDKKDFDNISSNLLKFQILNIVCGLYEFFVLHVKNDNLGGLFGTEQGCNAYLNIYILVISSYAIIMYMHKKMAIARTFCVVISSIVMATLGELKVFYVELVIIIICVILLEKKNSKTFFVVIGGIAGIFIGLQILSISNPESIEILSSPEELIEYSSRSDFGYGDIRISRMTAITQINEYFFDNDIYLRLFGYGLGACEDSTTFSIFNSSFADRYNYLQYRNISSSMLYLETGMVGLVLFIIIFVLYFQQAQKQKKQLEVHGYGHIACLVQIISILTVFLIWYNSAIRREIAYLTFFVLSALYVYVNHIEISN